MSQLFQSIIGGLVVVIIAAMLGIGGTTKVVVHGHKIRKSGKWIIIISTVMVLGGLYWVSRDMVPGKGFNFGHPGAVLAEYGFLFLIVGKIVAWFQSP